MSSTELSLPEWLSRIESLSAREIELGLDRVQTVMERLSLASPSRVFHVAGTNGKGSSVALLQALLLQSGKRVGSYTSPHVLHYNERITVDGRPATDVEIVTAFERIEAHRGDIPLTYFEYGTLAALVVFAEATVDAVILEVGLGGRLDAVNAVEPDAGLITNVSLDHCDWLGHDVESIGHEKAGIMRGGKPIVFASSSVPSSILQHAQSIGAELVLSGRDYHYTASTDTWSWTGRSRELRNLRLPSLRGEYQLANAAGVLALLEASGAHDLLRVDVINEAFSDVHLVGRMQSVESDGNWLLDVAHNPASAEALGTMLRDSPVAGQTIAITALLDDKDVGGVIGPLADVVDRWIAVTAVNARSIPASDLARNIANLSGRACLASDSINEAVEFARQLATADDRILVTGSFYVVGPVLEALTLYSRR